jgi:hypothetical protein
MKRIILHWSAGSWTPNATDKEHYHFLVTGAGKVVFGKFKPEDNLNCKDGKYAKHTGGCNTGSIGVAICGMEGYKSPQEPGIYPMRNQQFEATMNLIAMLCMKYKIPVTPETVFTHRTFGLRNPDTESAGKIDICHITCHPEVKPDDVDEFIRDKVNWYIKYRTPKNA